MWPTSTARGKSPGPPRRRETRRARPQRTARGVRCHLIVRNKPPGGVADGRPHRRPPAVGECRSSTGSVADRLLHRRSRPGGDAFRSGARVVDDRLRHDFESPFADPPRGMLLPAPRRRARALPREAAMEERSSSVELLPAPESRAPLTWGPVSWAPESYLAMNQSGPSRRRHCHTTCSAPCDRGSSVSKGTPSRTAGNGTVRARGTLQNADPEAEIITRPLLRERKKAGA
jgi:hypothetical protein